MLKPHVDVKDGSWRGTIRPSDTAAWFSSYDVFLTRYARMAQSPGRRALRRRDRARHHERLPLRLGLGHGHRPRPRGLRRPADLRRQRQLPRGRVHERVVLGSPRLRGSGRVRAPHRPRQSDPRRAGAGVERQRQRRRHGGGLQELAGRPRQAGALHRDRLPQRRGRQPIPVGLLPRVEPGRRRAGQLLRGRVRGLVPGVRLDAGHLLVGLARRSGQPRRHRLLAPGEARRRRSWSTGTAADAVRGLSGPASPSDRRPGPSRRRTAGRCGSRRTPRRRAPPSSPRRGPPGSARR